MRTSCGWVLECEMISRVMSLWVKDADNPYLYLHSYPCLHSCYMMLEKVGVRARYLEKHIARMGLREARSRARRRIWFLGVSVRLSLRVWGNRSWLL